MTPDELQARVAAFPRWYYRFDLGAVKTPVEPRLLARHAARHAHLFPPLLDACGGSLAGRRVLDVGCNAGFWALKAIEAGADHVLGIDARPIHIAQARLVFEALGVAVPRFDFLAADVAAAELSSRDPFDIVLCLGLLYHLAAPVEVIARLAAINTDILLVDTRVHRGDEAFVAVRERSDVPRNTVHDTPVLVPSAPVLESWLREAGYRVAPLPAPPLQPGMEDYADGRRMAYLCRKDPRR